MKKLWSIKFKSGKTIFFGTRDEAVKHGWGIMARMPKAKLMIEQMTITEHDDDRN